MKQLFFVALTALVLSSCAYHVHINFNDTYSGRVQQEIDFGGMMDMMASMGQPMTLDSVMTQDQIDSMIRSLDGMDGISEASLTPVNDRGYKIEYSFQDIEALNRAFESNEQTGLAGTDMNGFQFSRKGKNVTVDFPFMGDMGDSVDDYMGMMASQFTYSITLEFPKQVKKASYSGATVDGNTVILNEEDFDMFAKEKPAALKVKLK